ncbi:MAG: elongation factor 1-beta [Nanoarchaeota archaeon]|nr:elongation factor 1-beta [Nanoarchaeota archaeon]MBU1855163.1 elongation factor 1-beta [Nanoarchaeota archaeon]
MANVIATIKIMPTSPEVNLEELEVKVKQKIVEFAGEGDTKTEIEPIAFGLKALKIIFIMDESLGSPDKLSDEVQTYKGVNSAEITDVRRAVG